MLSVTINTNLKKIHEIETNEVILPTPAGLLGVLEGHRPMIARLDFGEMQIRKNGSYESILIGGGVAEIFENKVKILAPYAEFPGDIDKNRALKARDRADKRISDNEEEWDLQRSMAALARAVTRIDLTGR